MKLSLKILLYTLAVGVSIIFTEFCLDCFDRPLFYGEDLLGILGVIALVLLWGVHLAPRLEAKLYPEEKESA